MKFLKYLLLALALISATLAPVGAVQSPFIVTVSTVIPNGSANGSAAFTAAGYPQYTGTLSVRKITLAYTTTGTNLTERVELWNLCTSSTVATLVWSGVVQSTGLAGSGPFLQMDISPRLMNLTSPCFNKGVIDSAGTIKATLFYE